MKHIHFSKRAVAILLSSALLLIFSACSQSGGVSSGPGSSAASSDEPASSSAEIPLPAHSDTSSATSDTPADSGKSKDAASDDYQFAVNSDNTVTITKYTGKGGNVKIPAEIDGKKVTAIGNTFKETGAFQDCTTLTSVIIPDGVTEIQDNAFQLCTSLKTVTIPASVTLLRNCAFDACSNLQSIYFEGDAPQTGNYVFYPPLPTIYYHEGAAGWTNPWHGCPTKTFGEKNMEAGETSAEAGYASDSPQSAAAVSAYEAFLQGDADAEDPKHDLSESGTANIKDLFLGTNTLHALFDMNGDGIPELHLRPTAGGGYEIFTYRDGQVVLWHADVDYCSPLNNGALLYERPGGAPPHTNYMYITLDSNGNEIARAKFSKYDVVDESGLKVGARYIYEDNDVSKETWDALTKKFLSAKSDLIKWLAK